VKIRLNLLLVVMPALLVLSCDEQMSAHYRDRTAAATAFAFEQGWLPGQIPMDAVNIYEIHDIDTNRVWIRFDMPASTVAQFVGSLQRVLDNRIRQLQFPVPRRAKWWDLGVARVRSNRTNGTQPPIYSASWHQPEPGFVFVDQDNGRIYYWTE
jgi:hypothetical protein